MSTVRIAAPRSATGLPVAVAAAFAPALGVVAFAIKADVSPRVTAWGGSSLVMTLMNLQFTDPLFKNKFLLDEFIRFLRWSLPAGFLGTLMTQTFLTAFSW